MDPSTAYLFGTGLSAASAYAMNKASLKNQRGINDININLANTAHQREVADLRLAGLNPILSAGGQGAASNVAQSSAQFDNPLDNVGEGLSSAISASASRRLTNAQVVNVQAQSAKSIADAEVARAQADFWTSPEGRECYKQQQLQNALPNNGYRLGGTLLHGLYDTGATLWDWSSKAIRKAYEYYKSLPPPAPMIQPPNGDFMKRPNSKRKAPVKYHPNSIYIDHVD